MRALIRQWIEELIAKEQCPRLMVDATVAGVIVPDRVRRQWGVAMPIDLDPRYPLELRMDDAGLHCTLSFGGPWDCSFPWGSIYVVQDRDTQVGVIIEENLPESFALVDEGVIEPSSSPITARPVPGDRSGEDSELELESAVQRSEAVASPAEVLDIRLQDDADETAATSAEDRRARFRVIDGGKDEG